MAGGEDSGPGEHAVLTHLVVRMNELTPHIRQCLCSFARNRLPGYSSISRDVGGVKHRPE